MLIKNLIFWNSIHLVVFHTLLIICITICKDICVPSHVVVGTTYRCVCRPNGKYLCTRQDENLQKRHFLSFAEDTRSYSGTECENNSIYEGPADNYINCKCNASGQWDTEDCKTKLGALNRTENYYARASLLSLYYDFKCKPNQLYLLGCNICRCDIAGQLDEAFCTRRMCKKGRKGESCQFGSFLWADGEICMCSDLGYYLDDACIEVTEDTLQLVNIDAFSRMINHTDTSFLKIDDKCFMIMRSRFDISFR